MLTANAGFWIARTAEPVGQIAMLCCVLEVWGSRGRGTLGSAAGFG